MTIKERIRVVLAYLAMSTIIAGFVSLPVLASQYVDAITSLFLVSVMVMPTLIFISWLDRLMLPKSK